MPRIRPLAEHPANPLPPRATGDFAALHRLLEENGFCEPAVCAKLHIPSLYQFKAIYEGREIATELNDSLDILIRLFLDGEAIPENEATSRLGWPGPGMSCSTRSDCLPPIRIIRGSPGRPSRSTRLREFTHSPTVPVHLTPMSSFSPSERRYPAITENTGRFMSAIARTPSEDFLDLCSGSGIAAPAAGAGFARPAWSCDITERAVRFAEFARRLNGLGNVTVLRGDQASCPNWVALIEAACTGDRTGPEIYEKMRADEGIAPEMTPARFAKLLRKLSGGGGVENSAAPLPVSRA